jgi:hypothetical protein
LLVGCAGCVEALKEGLTDGVLGTCKHFVLANGWMDGIMNGWMNECLLSKAWKQNRN